MEPRPISHSASLQGIIEEAWDQRQSLSPSSAPSDLVTAIDDVLEALGCGQLKIVDKHEATWQVNEWLKKAILLSFRIYESEIYAPSHNCDWQRWFDKIPQKFARWTETDFQSAGLRALPGCYVRKSAFIGPRTVLMPCFINMGAHVGEGTLVDTWSTVGSCAYVGKNCHISGGVGIGGVLEPLQSHPVIIEDNCFIGARSEIAEGVIVEEGAVIAMGVFLGASTKIVDRATGEIFYGRVPAYSVVVPGTLPGRNPMDPSLACAVIVKRVDAQTRTKTSLNDLLRDDAA